jgi:hypothetical protein
MSRNAMEIQHLSLYRGSMRGTWKEEFEGYVMEGSGNGVFYL